MQSQFIEMFGDPRYNPKCYSKDVLSSIANITSGITKGRKTTEKDLIKVPYICTANVQDGHIEWSQVKYIDATKDEIEKYSLCNDDILMIEGGDFDKVGRGCLAGSIPHNCIYQNHVFRVRVNRHLIRPEFFAAYLLLPSTKEYFLSCAKQTTGIATINKKQLGEMPVMFPPLESQTSYLEVIQQADKSKFATQPCTLQHLMDAVIGQEA